MNDNLLYWKFLNRSFAFPELGIIVYNVALCRYEITHLRTTFLFGDEVIYLAVKMVIDWPETFRIGLLAVADSTTRVVNLLISYWCQKSHELL